MFNFLKNLLGTPDAKEIIKAIQDGAHLVDVRSAGEYAQGSLAGAENIPLEKIGYQASRLKDKPAVIVFCRTGFRSGEAKKILEKNGLKNVINGGNWQDLQNYIAMQGLQD
ncbi:MAG: rhodanese-like domain-containing protein [Spirosomataceae bacterium]